MLYRASVLVALAVSTTFLSLVGCDGGDVAVGSSDQKLQTRNDGSATGNGSTCSWEDPNAAVSSNGPTTAATTVHAIGDTFKALDGCNDCTCTDKGIMCTLRACSGHTSPGDPGQPVACTDEAKQCPDGSYVGRSGPNCEFAACPDTSSGQVCDANTGPCPDGESCYVLPNASKAICTSNPCASCAAGLQCTIQESYPARVVCN